MNHKLISLFFIVLVASCNKDDDIVIDAPDGPDDPGVSATVSPLNFSVTEYLPAPGQYINENVSGFNDIYTMDEACRQAEKRLQSQNYVSLGAWGGTIIVKFKHAVLNNREFNFAIAGNSFDTSNEPGIVCVMNDENNNGEPDDVWYELKGSYYGKEGYQRNYWVTYFRPEPGKNTLWKDCDGKEGYVNWLGSYHNQDYYYPNWIKPDSYTLHGTRLPLMAEKDPNTGIWSNPPFEWGYVDNQGKDVVKVKVNDKEIEANAFRISDAIDENGNEIKLDKIDFIKVQTAINGDTNIL